MLCWPRNKEIILSSKLVTPASTVVVALSVFKSHIKVNPDSTDEDEILQIYLDAAIAEAQSYTRRVFLAGAWITKFDYFPWKVTLDVCPVDVGSIIIQYYDTDNQIQTLPTTNYFVREVGTDEYLTIEFKGSMPSLYNKEYAVEVTYDAGYATIPSKIIDWILNRAASLYENRQSKVLGTTVTDVYDMSPLFQYKML